MVDPSLIIYHPVRRVGEVTVVTNGDQTDTIRDSLLAGKSYIDALRTRCYEPDGPNYTPRISGVVDQDGSFCLSILKSADGDPSCNHRYFYEYDAPLSGEGRFIHTYQENADHAEHPLHGIGCGGHPLQRPDTKIGQHPKNQGHRQLHELNRVISAT